MSGADTPIETGLPVAAQKVDQQIDLAVTGGTRIGGLGRDGAGFRGLGPVRLRLLQHSKRLL